LLECLLDSSEKWKKFQKREFLPNGLFISKWEVFQKFKQLKKFE